MNVTDLTTLFAVFYLSVLMGYKSILNCEVQRLLNKNVYVNTFVTFFCCFFLVSIFYQTDQTVWKVWLLTILGYLFLLIFLKTTIETVIIVFILLIIDQSLKISITSKLDKDPNADITLLNNLRHYIFYTNILIVLIGFGFYYMKQRKDHPDFSFITFFFGSGNCQL